MNIRSKILFLLLFYTGLTVTKAQDSLGLLTVDTVIVQISEDYKKGLSSQEFSKNTLKSYKSSSLSALLSRETGIYIKQYGTGLATATSRGGAAAHTTLLWEGINIASPLLGQNDLSILPIAFIDQLSWQASAASAIDGNAALGGSINIKSHIPYYSQWRGQALLGIGSFGQQNQQLRLSYGTAKYAMSIGFFRQASQNNFKFRDQNAFGNPKPWVRQKHATQEAFGIMHSQKIKWKSQEVSFKSWYQQNFRELPPTLLQTTGSDDEQTDASWRNLLSWRNVRAKRLQKITAAWIWNKLNYQSNSVNSKSQTQQGLLRWRENLLLTKAEQKWQQQLSYRVEGEYQRGSSNNYSSLAEQYLLAASLQYKLEHKKLAINFSLREQWVASEFLRPAGALNSQLKLWQKGTWLLAAQAAFSHNYRYPTFNDRYWPNAGNPDLQAEYSWSQEAGIRLQKRAKAGFFMDFCLTTYSNWVDNWIMWVPNAAIWRPENVAKVWARGTESTLLLGQRFGRAREWGCRLQHQLTLAERKDPDFWGRQLIYTPIHKANAELYYQQKNLSIRYQQQWVSGRFLNYSNSIALEPFLLGDLLANYQLKLSPLSLNFQFRLNNVFGTNYYLVSNYPMPRQNFQFSLLINY